MLLWDSVSLLCFVEDSYLAIDREQEAWGRPFDVGMVRSRLDCNGMLLIVEVRWKIEFDVLTRKDCAFV